MEWARRFPNPSIDGKRARDRDLARCIELEDFGESEAIDRFREMGVGAPERAALRESFKNQL